MDTTERGRLRRRLALLAGSLLPLALSARATAQTPIGIELRPFVGAYVPTGAQARLLKNGPLVGGQLAVKVNDYVSVVGTAMWSFNWDRTAAVDPAVDVYQYDIGAEAGTSKSIGHGAVLRPFAGLGAGGRSFGYRDPPRPQHSLAAYGALGGQLRMGIVGLRFEARGYASGFKGLTGQLTGQSVRKDITIASGLSVAL